MECTPFLNSKTIHPTHPIRPYAKTQPNPRISSQSTKPLPRHPAMKAHLIDEYLKIMEEHKVALPP